MAISVPDQRDVDLSPARGSRIVPVDTYAAPPKPAPADTSIGEALNILGNAVTGFDKKKADEDKANAELYVAQVGQAMQTAGKSGYDADIFNNVTSKLHPAARALVTQKFGYLQGIRDAGLDLSNPPSDILASPEKAQAWAQEQRQKAIEKSGSVPFYSAGYLEAYNEAVQRKVSQTDAQRTQAWNDTGKLAMRAEFSNAANMTARNFNPSYSPRPDDARAILEAADQLGISPVALATAISYETRGQFDPNIRGGDTGRRLGLIQFGDAEMAKYGARPGQSVREQMQAVVGYLKDRGLKPGMGLLDIYSTINAGRPGLYNRSDNGGKDNIHSHVDRMMREHTGKALQFLGLNNQIDPASSQPTVQASGKPSEASPVQVASNTTTMSDAAPQGSTGAPLDITTQGKEPNSSPVPSGETPVPPPRPANLDQPKDTWEQPIHPVDMPWEANVMLNTFFTKDGEIKSANPQWKAMFRDEAADAFINKALETNDVRYLQAFPGKLLDEKLRAQFRATAESIKHRKEADVSANRRETEEQRREQVRQTKMTLNDRLIDKKPLTPEEEKAINRVDPELVGWYYSRLKSLSEKPLTPSEKATEARVVQEKMEQIRRQAANGEDPKDMNTDDLRDPSNIKKVSEYAEQVARQGGEIGHSYYKDAWEEAKQAYWTYEYNQVKVVDPKMPKIKQAFEEYLEGEITKHMAEKGKPPSTRAERRQITKLAMDHVLAEFPARNTEMQSKANTPLNGNTPSGAGDPDAQRKINNMNSFYGD